MSKQEQFIEAIAPRAQEVQRKYGVPASIAIAQAALESGWGASAKGNNLFGIKASSTWNGARIDMATHEYLNGKNVGITDTFRAYGSLEESVDNYGKFLATNSRYAGVLAADNAHDAADALQRAGYATDPKYAAKLKAIINDNNLTRFDDPTYQGYTQGEKFEITRRRLREQREANPDVWSDFMKGFVQLIASIFSGVSAMLFGGDQQTASAPSPTPARAASAQTTTPPRG